MDGEFNNLSYNNTNITFSNTTNNIATSDETSADPVYIRQMGTNYSRSKKVSRAITITGLTLTFTALAVAGGSVVRNIFVPNPPTVVNPNVVCAEGELTYSFTIENKLKYKTTYYLDINGENVLKEECSEPKEYNGTYSPIEAGSRCKFYVSFTNSLDYFKTIFTKEFIA